jgi:hypothetical protein
MTTAVGSEASPHARREARRKRSSNRRQRSNRVRRANNPYGVPKGMSHSRPIARRCIPQKQTHQIAMTALRNAASASGGFGPDRIGRAPWLAMASSSASTWSTKTSTSETHPTAQETSSQHGRRFPCSGPNAIGDGDLIGCSPLRARYSTRLKVAVEHAPTGSGLLQTVSYLLALTILSPEGQKILVQHGFRPVALPAE